MDNFWCSVLWLAIVAVMFYFLFIIPNSRRRRQYKEMLETLKVGDEVATIGGIMGKVMALEDGAVTLMSGDNGALIKVTIEAIAIRNSEK